MRDESSETKMNLISSILPKNMDFDNNNKVCNVDKFYNTVWKSAFFLPPLFTETANAKKVDWVW